MNKKSKPRPSAAEKRFFKECFPCCNFQGIVYKKELALEEIAIAERRLIERGFSKSQVRQYEAVIINSTNPDEVEFIEKAISESGDVDSLQSFHGLDLWIFRKNCFTWPPNVKMWNEYIRILEVLALLWLITRDLSAHEYEMVQSELHRRDPEITKARKIKVLQSRAGLITQQEFIELRDRARQEWKSWIPQSGKKTKVAFFDYFRDRNGGKPEKPNTMYEWLQGL